MSVQPQPTAILHKDLSGQWYMRCPTTWMPIDHTKPYVDHRGTWWCDGDQWILGVRPDSPSAPEHYGSY